MSRPAAPIYRGLGRVTCTFAAGNTQCNVSVHQGVADADSMLGVAVSCPFSFKPDLADRDYWRPGSLRALRGAGSVAAGLRAGVPTLILWPTTDRRMWGAIIKRMHAGTARRISNTATESLFADLHQILAADYVSRAREVATQLTAPAESVAAAADLLENFARARRAGATRGRTPRGTAAP